jgi:uncharacterized protein YyaL (SSP411 family)
VTPHETTPEKPNRLTHEKSPYLLQHAHNPVDWYPWGDEAFERARADDKPIFLSIGYATCHWCHVMERESFEDEEVARLLNDGFVSIKVDREERPDIDNVYMTVCQSMTGSGGWPLSIVMTPEKKPFFAATYIPKHARFGRAGMLELLPRVLTVWREKRSEATRLADHIAESLSGLAEGAPGAGLDRAMLDTAYHHLAESFDESHGGFGGAPKFPTSERLRLLLRHWRRTGDPDALQMVEQTLASMRRGGIYDHVGFGFHRYSTDERWLVPHFEKMLYDQALLAIAYLEAYQATDNPDYASTAREIFTYVLRDMTSPEGGFYSAEDADSEGEEGKFYLWNERELREVLSPTEAEAAVSIFNVEGDGNFLDEATRAKTGANILHLAPSGDKPPELRDLTADELEGALSKTRGKLLARREERVRPFRDDKVLPDWNGLMIAALAKGGRILGEPRYTNAAAKAAAFVLREMRDEQGRLFHRYRVGERAITGFLDDYAFLTWGLIEVYEATFEVHHLQAALGLTETLIGHFWDDTSGGLFMTPDFGEALLVRSKEAHDGAVPSGNSVAMMNLLRLARMTGRSDLEEKAAEIGKAFADMVRRAPSAFAALLSAVDFGAGPSYEVVITGEPGGEDVRAMIAAVRTQYVPNKVVLFRPSGEESPEIAALASFTRELTAVDGKATAYVCQDHTCALPTTDALEMLRLLGVSEGTNKAEGGGE